MLPIYRLCCLSAMLALVGAAPGVSGEKQAKVNPDGDIEVVLRFSVETLDPLRPGDSYVECTVRNKSDKPLQVPTRYGSGFNPSMTLTAGTLRFGLRLVVWAGEKKLETELLKPGETRTIFKETLKEALALEYDRAKPLKPNEKRYYWTWNA